MKIRPRFPFSKLFAACALLAASPTSGLVAQVPDSTSQTITLPISSRLTVALADSLHSSTARIGQEFGVVLTEPLTDTWGTMAAPAGTPAAGRVLNAQKAGLFPGEGRLVFTIRAIQIGDRSYAIRTNSMTIEGGREGWIKPLNAQIRTGRTFLFTLVAPLTLPVAPQ